MHLLPKYQLLFLPSWVFPSNPFDFDLHLDRIPYVWMIIVEKGIRETSRQSLGGSLGWGFERELGGRVWCILLANLYCTDVCLYPPSLSWWLTCSFFCGWLVWCFLVFLFFLLAELLSSCFVDFNFWCHSPCFLCLLFFCGLLIWCFLVFLSFLLAELLFSSFVDLEFWFRSQRFLCLLCFVERLGVCTDFSSVVSLLSSLGSLSSTSTCFQASLLFFSYPRMLRWREITGDEGD